MLLPGQILYFSNFQFTNGNTPKPKYFVVLCNKDNKIIIASLPTRTDRAPSFINIEHGCINIDERCFNCYRFAKNKPIGEKGFAFDMDCFIYGDQVQDLEMESLTNTYIENIDYALLDTLHQTEFDAIIHCLCNSTSVRRKIKRFLME